MGEHMREARVKEASRVLDEAARRRRQRKALEALEHDNFSEDPHADLKMSKKAPKFEEVMEVGSGSGYKRKKKAKVDFKLRYRKNFSALLEEEHLLNREGPSYTSSCAPPPKLPERKFCAVCGFPSNYTCKQCGTRYCCVRCLGTHQDTRCLKWTA